MVTLYPLACSNLAKDAPIIPFPKEEETPPVTNMYFVVFICPYYTGCKYKGLLPKQADKLEETNLNLKNFNKTISYINCICKKTIYT